MFRDNVLVAFRAKFKRFEKPLILLIICVGSVILLKWGVVSGYIVPTSSMEPTLFGHPDDGDRIAVFKLSASTFRRTLVDRLPMTLGTSMPPLTQR